MFVWCSQIVNAEEDELDPRGCAEMVIADSNNAVEYMGQALAVLKRVFLLHGSDAGIILAPPELFFITDGCVQLGMDHMTVKEQWKIVENQRLITESINKFLDMESQINANEWLRGSF
jgi:hypothetical protein